MPYSPSRKQCRSELEGFFRWEPMWTPPWDRNSSCGKDLEVFSWMSYLWASKRRPSSENSQLDRPSCRCECRDSWTGSPDAGIQSLWMPLIERFWFLRKMSGWGYLILIVRQMCLHCLRSEGRFILPHVDIMAKGSYVTEGSVGAPERIRKPWAMALRDEQGEWDSPLPTPTGWSVKIRAAGA